MFCTIHEQTITFAKNISFSAWYTFSPLTLFGQNPKNGFLRWWLSLGTVLWFPSLWSFWKSPRCPEILDWTPGPQAGEIFNLQDDQDDHPPPHWHSRTHKDWKWQTTRILYFPLAFQYDLHHPWANHHICKKNLSFSGWYTFSPLTLFGQNPKMGFCAGGSA